MNFQVTRLLQVCIVMALLVFMTGCASTAVQNAVDSGSESSTQNELDYFLEEMLKMHYEKTMCALVGDELTIERLYLVKHLQAKGYSNEATKEDIATAIWTLFPCPFTPYRKELLPALEEDIHGAWFYPETSRSLRYGKKVDINKSVPVPLKCESFAYYPDGELRTVEFRGKAECPVKNSRDMEATRILPNVATWELVSPGRMSVSRTDVEDHIEEWDTYLVLTSFEESGIQFEQGDLIQYLRRTRNNEFNASTQFRHLVRLPD